MKKYLILYPSRKNYPTPNPDYRTTVFLTPKIKTGYSIDTIKKDLALQDTFTPSPTDILYLYPGCTVPRYKLKDKFTTTLVPSKATAIFFNADNEIIPVKAEFRLKDNCLVLKTSDGFTFTFVKIP